MKHLSLQCTAFCPWTWKNNAHNLLTCVPFSMAQSLHEGENASQNRIVLVWQHLRTKLLPHKTCQNKSHEAKNNQICTAIHYISQYSWTWHPKSIIGICCPNKSPPSNCQHSLSGPHPFPLNPPTCVFRTLRRTSLMTSAPFTGRCRYASRHLRHQCFQKIMPAYPENKPYSRQCYAVLQAISSVCQW